MDKNYVWQIGEYIAAGHKISEASEHFGKSISSIKKYLAKIRDKENEFYNEILAEKIRLAQAKIEIEGRIKGGETGKRGRCLCEWQTQMLLEAFISSGLSLDEFADLVFIPKSTLYDNFMAINDPELFKKFRDYMSRYKPYHKHEKIIGEDGTWTR